MKANKNGSIWQADRNNCRD